MQSEQGNLFTRDDTFFGVCEGLGQDFGIHPNFLRVALAGALFWNPPMAGAAYVAAGVVVLVSRLLVPEPKPIEAPAPAIASAAAAVAEEHEPVALAA